MRDFEGKVAVITGAASGFGLEFARLAAGLRMKLVLADVQEQALEAARTELVRGGAEVMAHRCDVRKATEVEALADATIRHFGGVHLVFNNAGVLSGGLVWEHSLADWDWVLGVNLWGAIHGVRSFVPRMLECARRDPAYTGHIVNTASMAGLLNVPNMGAYNVSKHAVVSLSETLYHDLQLIGAPVGASVLCPYFVPTGIHQSERLRPNELQAGGAPSRSQRAARAVVEKAVTSGKVSAAEVAQATFDAIQANRFYVYSHPHALGNVQARMEDILNARNPSDPFAAAPQVRELLKARLQADD